MNDVQLLIHCDQCSNWWDIDNDPDCCICDTDAGWQLLVVDDNEPFVTDLDPKGCEHDR